MELVRGFPITEYCDTAKLSTRQRLELFITVCRAVQHAHLKGIIHRDIKPSNVLVTQIDGEAVPKVIDFGVAKATHQRLTEHSVYTQFAQMIGTPLYMSPEQAEMSGVDVDTRADVYSLGVLLYELLTGTTPFDKDTLKQAGFDEMRRIIREDEPPKPSDRVSTLAAEALSTVSEKRRHDPRRLSDSLRGELDWIVLRAMEKDRTRRYESASDLAADIERYLNDEPVEACPPSTTYRLRKFARRNKTVLTTITLVTLSLMIGTGVSIWQAAEAVASKEIAEQRGQEADRQRGRAQVSLGKALEAVDKMLTRVGDETLKNVPLMDKVRRELLRDALELCQSLLRENNEDPTVRHALGNAFRRMGDVHEMLGDHAAAAEAFQQAIAILDPLAAGFPLQPAYQSDLSISHRNLGNIYRIIGRFDEAEAAGTRALTIARKLTRAHPQVAEYQKHLAGSHHNLGRLHYVKGRLGEAETAYLASLSIRITLADKHPDVPVCQQDLAGSHNNLGLVYQNTGRFDEAEAAFQVSLGIQKTLADEHPDVPEYQESLAVSHNNLGSLYMRMDRFVEAEAAYQVSLSIQEKLADRHPDVPEYQQALSSSHNNLGLVYKNTGRIDEAEAAYSRSLTIQDKLAHKHSDVPKYQKDLAGTHSNLGIVYRETERLDEALESFQNSIDIYSILVSKHPDVRGRLGKIAGNLAWHLATAEDPRLRDPEKAVKYGLIAVKCLPDSAWARENLGVAYVRAGQYQLAVETLQQADRMRNGKDDAHRIFLCMALWQTGQRDEARRFYAKAVAWMQKNKPRSKEQQRFADEARELLEIPAVVQHTDVVESIVFLPDGAGLWSASSDKTIKRWGVAGRKYLDTLTEHTDKVESVAVSADGKTVASASKDNTIRLWNAQTGTLLQTLSGHAKAVRAVAFSPDGKSLVSVSLDMTVRLWDTATGKQIRELGRHDAGLRAVAFSPTGKLVASAGDDQTIRMWNPDSGELVAELSGHTAEIRGLAFSPDGRLLASAAGKKGSENTDWTARIWDVATRQPLHELTGHTGAVRTVAFSPDGQTLATGSYDKTVKLWHVDSGQLQTTLEGHADTVRTVAFSPDGKTLAVGGAGIKLWDLAKGQSVAFPQVISSLEEARVNSQGREPLEDERTQQDQP